MDFTGYRQLRKAYGGANGKKISIFIDGKLYMLKFPSESQRNDRLSYLNGTVSEYIGCHIFNRLGIKAQETLLGTFTAENGKVKTVVACKDFCSGGIVLQDFASLKNRIIDSNSKGQNTELDSLLETMEKQDFMDSAKLQAYFWDMFIADAYIGNWDRHNGNWGFLYDQTSDSVSLAPVYDCGSCLYPSADEQTMKDVLNNENELKLRVYERPTSAIMLDGKRIRYYDFISSLEYEGCNDALMRIYPKIVSAKTDIEKIIDGTPFITDFQKDFYKAVLEARRDMILKVSYARLFDRRLSNAIEIAKNNDKCSFIKGNMEKRNGNACIEL